MRILMAAQTYRPATNGAAVFTIRLAEGLARAGHQVTVLMPSSIRRSYQTWQGGVCLQAVGAVSLAPFYGDIHVTLRPGREVAALVDQFHPEVLHLHDHYPLSRAALRTARVRLVPVVGTNNFLPDNLISQMPVLAPARRLLERLLWQTVRATLDQVDVVTAATETSASILRRQGIRRPVLAISCGVDMHRFRPDAAADRLATRRRYGLDPQRPAFLYVGRLDADKCLGVLLHALHRLGHADVQLAIAGRGSHMPQLAALASRLGLGERVVFTGYVPDADLPALLNSVDIFAMPGEAELQCLAALEAMATGRPLLLARACALPELVEPGVNGYLFRAGDPEDAARFMARLLAERERWPQMGAVSLARAQPHSLDHTIRQYEKLYRQLIGQGEAESPHEEKAPAIADR